jgi:7-carboxy-7-deazaguanine synthase
VFNSLTKSDTAQNRLRITEIFHSLQGEARDVGWPTVFVRLTGCPLRCGYCDTTYAFQGGEWMAIADILSVVAQYGTRHVCVTGGEPLAQKPCLLLLGALCRAGYEVSLETSGALDISTVDMRVVRVVDLKTPGSGEESRNLLSNLEHLRARDQVKFVICDRVDYDWAKQLIATHQLNTRCELLFSPSFGQLEARQLAQWILDDHLPVRFQMQLHKVVWGEERGR